MLESSSMFRSEAGLDHRLGGRLQHVGVVGDALSGAERLASLAALFPRVAFDSAGPVWPEPLDPHLDILIVGVDAASAEDVQAATRRLAGRRPSLQVLVALRNADVTTMRRLVREGAADVLPAPVSEASLALSLERLLAAAAAPASGDGRSGEVIAVIKAGGGVGATALCAQAAALLAGRGKGEVCLADLDLQFGAASLYLDLPEAISVSDVLASGASLADTPLGSALTTHRSGARLLAAPREVVPLETLQPNQADALVGALRRAFALTIVDLPSVWTAWTNQVLNLADRIVMVTQLSVPHVQLVKRQLRVMSVQRLDDKPLILVCNAPSSEQQATVSIKAAERALGRPFDVVVPEDRRLMLSALNQGLEIGVVKRGSRIEKAIVELAGLMAAPTPAGSAGRS